MYLGETFRQLGGSNLSVIWDVILSGLSYDVIAMDVHVPTDDESGRF